MPDEPAPAKLFGRYQEVVLLLIGCLLTSGLGGWIAGRYQKRSWSHEHMVQVCDAQRETMAKGLANISDLMDKRLLRMRQLAWKLEKARSFADVDEERRNNREARDEWAMHLNSNLWFFGKYFGASARSTLENDIAGGFSKIHNHFNDLFNKPTLDKTSGARIESEIDALNPTIYMFDIEMGEMITQQPGKCDTRP